MNITQKALDKLVFGFLVLFLLTLHNSIFLNQIGYYGALIVLLFKAGYNKINPFLKTGLEIYFVLFILTEILSTIFSVAPSNAFHNLLKRALLIPIVYVVYTAADTKEKAMLFFKIYIGAALITLAVYIAFAYEHFIHQLYQLETKGPSPFQYVMTAGGLISFTVIFLFAFLLDEKMGWRVRTAVFIAFLLSALALAASYTRAAWIGAAAGLFIVLLLKRKWIIIIPAILVLGWFILSQKTTSTVYFQNSSTDSLVEQINYSGKLLSTYTEGDSAYFSAYEKGVVFLEGSTLKPIISAPAPVTQYSKWNDDVYMAFLVDQRCEIYKPESGSYKRVNEILSPGNTSSYVLNSNGLYITDLDSGLTVFTDPMNSYKKYRYPEIKQILRLAVNDSVLAGYSHRTGILSVFKLKNSLPSKIIFEKQYKTDFGFISLIDKYLIFSTEDKTELMSIENNTVKQKDVIKALNNITSFVVDGGRLYAFGFRNELLELNYPIKDEFKIIRHHNLKGIPGTFAFGRNKFVYTISNVSRLNSILDPYHPTNIQRIYQWHAGISIVKDYPLFGVGDIDMKEVYDRYKNYFEKELFGHLHNNYIHLLAALGIIGFVIVLVMLIKIFITHFSIYKKLKFNSFASSFSLGAFGAFIGFLVSGLAEWNFGDHEIITMVWFFLGLNLAFFRHFGNNNQNNTQELPVG